MKPILKRVQSPYIPQKAPSTPSVHSLPSQCSTPKHAIFCHQENMKISPSPGNLETLDARGREIYGSVYYFYFLFYRYFGG